MFLARMSRVLVSWFGATDLRAAKGEAPAGLGPVAQALQHRKFDQVVLITNYEKADSSTFEAWLKTKTSTEVTIRTEKLRSPTDFTDIHRVVTKTLAWLLPKLEPKSKLTFHLSPGTPAMAIVWILLAPRYDAELIQSSKEAGVEAANIPFEIAAEFVPALARSADAELERLGEAGRPEDPSFADILGRSPVMKRLIERSAQAAPYSAPILVEGESGTGKELLAAASGVFKPYAGVSTAIVVFTKGGKTDHVFFYDVAADGFSLDDKRDPITDNDLPTALERWRKKNAKKDTDRTAKHFMVPVKDIEEKGYDLSINRYKETVHEEVTFEPPKKIIAKLKKLEAEIAKDLDELEAML